MGQALDLVNILEYLKYLYGIILVLRKYEKTWLYASLVHLSTLYHTWDLLSHWQVIALKYFKSVIFRDLLMGSKL